MEIWIRMSYLDFMHELIKMYGTKLWVKIYNQTGIRLGVDDIKPQDASSIIKIIKNSKLLVVFKKCLEEYILIQSGPNEYRLENINQTFKLWCRDRGIMLSWESAIHEAIVTFCMEMPCFYDLQAKCLFFYFS